MIFRASSGCPACCRRWTPSTRSASTASPSSSTTTCQRRRWGGYTCRKPRGSELAEWFFFSPNSTMIFPFFCLKVRGGLPPPRQRADVPSHLRHQPAKAEGGTSRRWYVKKLQYPNTKCHFESRVGKRICVQMGLSENLAKWWDGIPYSTICWWSKTSREEKKTVSSHIANVWMTSTVT